MKLPAEPEWMRIARNELGVSELPGADHNARIIEYHAKTTLKATADEIPWCSSFANWCMAQAGIKGTGSAAARSWMSWGVPLAEPIPGCIVVIWRGEVLSTAAHVGFLAQMPNRLHIPILGGNQGDRVSIANFKAGRLLGYRWPAGIQVPVFGADKLKVGG